jgi:RNA polymerase primary sigma factor
MADAGREARIFGDGARADRPPPGIERASSRPGDLRILGTRIEYVAHPSFDDPDARDEILAEMPGPSAVEAVRWAGSPDGMHLPMAGLCELPLLSREQEAHLFRKMNYLKSRAERARARPDPEEFERLRHEAVAVKQQIIRANLRLVISIARRFAGRRGDLADLISVGNLALIRAVDKFDFARGNKFSSYATWAIRNDLFGTVRRDAHLRDRPFPGHAEIDRDTVDTRADPGEQQRAQDRRARVVAALLGRLNERERRILVGRFGIGGAREETLSQIGVELGISKERVRQLEARARDRLRRLARTEAHALLPA